MKKETELCFPVYSSPPKFEGDAPHLGGVRFVPAHKRNNWAHGGAHKPNAYVYHTILHVECAFTFYQLLLSRTGSVHKAENDFLKALDADLYVGTGMYLSD
jgi:hypothetical protein